MRFQLFLGAWGLTGALAVGYVVWGAVADLAAKVLDRRKKRVLETLSVLLFESEAEAEAVHDRVRKLPRRTLLAVIQSLAVDLTGEAYERLRRLAQASGIQRFVVRRSTSRRWRLRVQAAQLQYLVVDPNYDRGLLLKDRHPLVRARAIESLSPAEGEAHLKQILHLLGDPALAVRISAQQKLLDVGAAAIPDLIRHLRTNHTHVLEVLELAANLADPRLTDTLDEHASSADPAMRLLTARALGNGAASLVAPILERLVGDVEEDIRSVAIASLGKIGDPASATLIGPYLSDRAWSVRRASGLALDQLGSTGRLILRQHLESPDPFARDMARQILDAAAQRGLPAPPPLVDPLGAGAAS